MKKLTGDFEIGGGWGNAINWNNVDWKNLNFEKDLADVVGWKTPIPEIGQTLVGEFSKCFVKFSFTEIEPCHNPSDMFFGKVKAIEQKMK